MRLTAKLLIAVVAAAVSFALPQTASAERIYYLVGVRHIYRIGTDRYYRATERRQIEEDYADEVSADNSHYQYRITHGGDRSIESRQLSSALHDLAAERERRLAKLYPQCDYVRHGHREFDITVDGPYQVIGVDYHVRDTYPVYDDFVAYAPWPGYVCEGPDPYGWRYGVVYAPGAFINVYNGWYGGWVGFGCPAFVGFYGFGGPIVCAGLSVNIGIGFGAGFGVGIGGFFFNDGLGGFYHRGPGYFASDPFRGGYIAGRGDPRAAFAARAGFRSGAGAIRSARANGFAAGIRAGSRSSFASGSGRVAGAARTLGTGGARAGSFAPRGGTGYAHSAIGARMRAGGAARSATAARAGSARSVNAARAGNARARSAARAGSGRAAVARRSAGSGRSSVSSSRRSFGGGRSSFGGGRTFGGGGRSMGGARSGFGGGGRSFGGGHAGFGGGGGRSAGGNRGGGGGRRRGG